MLTITQINEFVNRGCTVSVRENGFTIKPPAIREPAMTPAQRAKAYRERLKTVTENVTAQMEIVTENVTVEPETSRRHAKSVTENVTAEKETLSPSPFPPDPPIPAPTPAIPAPVRESRKRRTADEQAAANAVALGMTASPALREAWARLKAYRTERGSNPFVGEKVTIWTRAASEALARKLESIAEQLGDPVAIQCAATSIERRWLDIFPPEQRKSQTTPKANHGSATNPDEYA